MTRRPAAPLTEQQFLAQYDASRFPHPSVAVDVAVLTVADGALQVLAVQRTEHPALGHWSLPGGFVQLDESLDDAAHRVLAVKAGLQRIFLEQLYTFGEPLRDPRTRVISVAYYALVPASQLPAAAAEPHGVQLARLRVPWSGERGGPVNLLDGQSQPLPVAFDHADILGLAVKRLRGKLNYAPLGFELLPRKFTLRQLQTIHETILDQRLNKDSFRRRMLATGLLAPTGQYESDVGHRPAELYRFKRKPTP